MRRFPALVTILLATTAHAEIWAVDAAKSSLTFAGTQESETFKGAFKNFTSEIDFAEAAPEKSRIHITVDMASATVDGKDRADALPSDDWFAVKQFPKAEFTSTSIVKTGEHQFAAKGNLTLRGITKEITLPFTLKKDGPTTVADGSLNLNRSDYAIGQGRWTDDKWIAFPVSVVFHIAATPK